MPNRPAYKPVAFLDEPGAWDTDGATWRTPQTDLEATLLAASMLQHRLSRQIWTRLKTEKLSVAALATTLGQGDGQLWRKLAGKNPAGVLDLCLWAWLVGDDEAIASVTRAFADREPTWPVR